MGSSMNYHHCEDTLSKIRISEALLINIAIIRGAKDINHLCKHLVAQLIG